MQAGYKQAWKYLEKLASRGIGLFTCRVAKKRENLQKKEKKTSLSFDNPKTHKEAPHLNTAKRGARKRPRSKQAGSTEVKRGFSSEKIRPLC